LYETRPAAVTARVVLPPLVKVDFRTVQARPWMLFVWRKTGWRLIFRTWRAAGPAITRAGNSTAPSASQSSAACSFWPEKEAGALCQVLSLSDPAFS